MLGAMASVSLKRITRYLQADELEEEKKDDTLEGYNSNGLEKDNNKKSVIKLENATFSWSSIDGEPCLKDMNLNVEKNSLIAVVGKVGSG
jgi:ABC-type multidrug transport system fused ATPase/permease subunit